MGKFNEGILKFLYNLFMGGQMSPTATQTTTAAPSGYQSPIVGLLDPMMVNMLAQNMQRGANWGWPAGKGINTSWIDQMLSLLGSEWPKIMAGYKSGNMAGGLPTKKKSVPITPR